MWFRFDNLKQRVNNYVKWIYVIVPLLICVCNSTVYSVQNYFLDDVELINTEISNYDNLNKFVYDWDIINQVVVKNSNWERCPLSGKFLEKYNAYDSILPSLDVVSIEPVNLDINKISIDKHKTIFILHLDDGNEISCVFKCIWNERMEIDDILVYIISNENMKLSYEEIYMTVLND